MIDEIDKKILQVLKNDSRKQWKEIGEIVHMTGQAVSARIRKMEDIGIIKKFTIEVNEISLGNLIQSFVVITMKTTNHSGLQTMLKTYECVKEIYRITGVGCYLIKISAADQQEFDMLLENILIYGNYTVVTSMDKIL